MEHNKEESESLLLQKNQHGLIKTTTKTKKRSSLKRHTLSPLQSPPTTMIEGNNKPTTKEGSTRTTITWISKKKTQMASKTTKCSGQNLGT